MKHLYGPGKIGWSFEVFPPKTAEAMEAMYASIGELKQHAPLFISVTYGAGGSTRDLSLEIARQIRQRFQLSVTAHFTCVGSTRDDIQSWLKQAEALQVANIMALRGDPPQGQKQFVPVAGGFRFASELVAFIRSEFPGFGIGVAGYPEVHQEALSPEQDLENLKRKVDLGGDVVYTQLFYDNADFLRFRDKCDRIGIRVPIVPGLLPVLNLKQVQRITSLCKAKLPAQLVEQLEARSNDPAGQMEVGIAHCTEQCQGLLEAGVPGIHFYVLNRADAVRRILAQLRPSSSRSIDK